MSPLGLILIIILIVVLFGGGLGPRIGAPWQYGYGFGNQSIGILGVILIVILILWAMGRI
jgi:hypothetical protein